MEEIKKHCDTCAYSYYSDRPKNAITDSERQYCRNPLFNSPAYTYEMFMADRSNDYCRFWKAKNEKKGS